MDKLKDTGISRSVELLKRKRITLSLILTLMGFVVQGNKESVTAQTTNPNPDKCVTGNNINIRIGEGTQFKAFDSISPGDVLRLVSDENEQGWRQVETLDGRLGFVTPDPNLIKVDDCSTFEQQAIENNNNPRLIFKRHRKIGDLNIFGENPKLAIDETLTDEQLYRMSEVIKSMTDQTVENNTFDNYELGIVFATSDEAALLFPNFISEDTHGLTGVGSFNGVFLAQANYGGVNMTLAIVFTDRVKFTEYITVAAHELAHGYGKGHGGLLNAYDIGEMASFAYAAIDNPNSCNPDNYSATIPVEFCNDLAHAMSDTSLVNIEQ